ncbi:MAG: tetratricopeptide repeat protein [Bryobacteraceae bacterium]
MRRLPLLLAITLSLSAADRWVDLRYGPFEVVTAAGERPARARLNEFEQLRGAVEQVLGKKDLAPAWPIRIVVVGSRKHAGASLVLARDAFTGAVAAKGPPPSSLFESCARILIESGQGRLPAEMENGLVTLLSTLEFRGPELILGVPPPTPQRTLDWARLHLLSTKEEYYGKLRTLVYNLERGVEAEPAYRNALGKTPAEIDKEAEAYLRAGDFPTIPLRRRPINPDKDFAAKPVDPGRAAVIAADLLLTDPSRTAEARAAYQSILRGTPSSPEALEGLGLAMLIEKRPQEAKDLLSRAIEAGSTNARAYLEYARLEPDRDKAVAALEKSAKLNPRWAEPHFEMAGRESDAALRVQLLAAAARLEPRNSEYWRALAEAQEAAGEFVAAARSWASAELAAPSTEERRRLRETRQQAEVRRREQEQEQRERKAEDERRALEALKQKSFASIQAALDKANRENPAIPPASGKVEPWWDGPRPDAKVQGVLRQVDCLGKQARLVIEAPDRRVTRLIVRDPGQIFIAGGEQSLTCGPQKPARRVVVEYFAKPDAKLGTVGEVAVLEFP